MENWHRWLYATLGDFHVSKIGRLWAGKIFGTNTGNVSAEFDSSDTDVHGIIRVMDDRFGLSVFQVSGSFDGSLIDLTGTAIQAAPDISTGEITVKGTLTPEGQLRGEWSSTLGTGGAFALFPHDAQNSIPQTSYLPPEQLHSATRQLGALRLYPEDIRELVGLVTRDFSQGRVIVTYRERGNEISKYAVDFESNMQRLGDLRFLKLFIQEHEAYGINRSVLIELHADGQNEVRVQGVQESWVIGKAEAIASHLRQRQKPLATTFRKFGLNINGLLAVGALLLLPELSLSRRVIFAVAVVLILATIAYLHSRFIPNVLIHAGTRTSTSFDRIWPQFLSWTITATAALVAAIVYGVLRGELTLPFFAP